MFARHKKNPKSQRLEARAIERGKQIHNVAWEIALGERAAGLAEWKPACRVTSVRGTKRETQTSPSGIHRPVLNVQNIYGALFYLFIYLSPDVLLGGRNLV